MLLLFESMRRHNTGRESVTGRFSQQQSSERGASLVEYSLLVALIAVVCIGAVTFFGGELASSLSTSGASVN